MCRAAVEAAIDWDCEVIKDYAETNVGILDRIGFGAKRVLEKEEYAIFLEDDNYPEETFFYFCKEMLLKYRDHTNILWVCGTNYLEEYDSPYSYVFTRHTLPCGWASWADKYCRYYDGELENATPEKLKLLRTKYESKALYEQQKYCIRKELYRRERGKKFISWDYQMAFSVRYNDKFGISPCNNQIRNIGVDGISEHGGNNMSNVMTNRFCGMESHPLEFPLNHPEKVEIDPAYEKKIQKIILNPWIMRFRRKIKCFILRLLGMNDAISFSEAKQELRKRFKKK